MIRGVALLLTVLTGFSGLVYEVAWQQYLAVLLGSHSEATAAVLGIFLGGLSYGYFLFGRLSRAQVARARARGEPPRLLLLYGAVEAAIGVYALCFPALFAGAQALSLALPSATAGLAFAVDLALTALLIGPPTILMGGTVPLLTQGLTRDVEDATRLHALVYATNTLGAFLGALAAGFLLVPWLGLRGCVLAMGAVNLAAGGVFLAVGRRVPQQAVAPREAIPEPAVAAEPERAPAAVSGLLVCSGVALLAGFAMMTLQTAMNRIGALSLGASHFTFAMVVATFVLCIALGSFAVSALPRVRPSYLPLGQWLLVVYLLLLYPLVEDAPYWAHVVRMHFASQPANFLSFHLAIFLSILSIFAVPVALSGALLPLLFHDLRRERGDLGSVAGRLYSWNTVGSLAGALLSGYALLFWLDLHHTYRIAVLALATGATLLTLRALPGARTRALVLVGLALVVLGVAMQPAWAPERLAAGLFRSNRPTHGTSGPDAFFAANADRAASVLFYDDDPSATISVMEIRPGSRSIVTNGKSDGNVPVDNPTTGMLALLPALLADEVVRSFVIGYGTGMSVGELVALDSMREVVVAEISTAVIDAAPLFEPLHRGAAFDPKTKIVRSDAYRALLRSPGGYDVILSEPSNPWVTGVEMLFSVEFLKAAREKLSPGGVYAQWFHFHETDAASLRLVFKSYLEAFPRTAAWYGGSNDLVLVGFARDDHEIDLSVLERRFDRADFREQFAAIGVTSLPRLLAHEILPLGVVNEMDLGDRVHTILHPRLSHSAARAFFFGRPGRLPTSATANAARAGATQSLVQRFARERFAGRLPDDFRLELLRAACLLSKRRCATLWSSWIAEAPDSPVLAERLAMARSDERLARPLRPEKLARLAGLYRADGTADVNASFVSAVEVANAFLVHYDHAAPFHAEALRGVWRRCDDDARCAAEWPRIEGFGTLPE